jgi:hypothetical protein
VEKWSVFCSRRLLAEFLLRRYDEGQLPKCRDKFLVSQRTLVCTSDIRPSGVGCTVVSSLSAFVGCSFGMTTKRQLRNLLSESGSNRGNSPLIPFL